MELQQFIEENRESILLEWEAFAASLPSAGNTSRPELRDHAVALLDAICVDMRTAGCAPGIRDPGSETSIGQLHVQDRKEKGFTLNEIMAEYSALRASVIRLWRQQRGGASESALGQLCNFNESIDRALIQATDEFCRQAERSQDLVREQREVDRHKNEFLTILAHELRNPLGPIKTGLELMTLSRHDPVILDRTIGMMDRQLECLIRLADDLLDISRINRGKIELRVGELDLREAVSAALEVHAGALTAEQRLLHTGIPQQAVRIRGDFFRLVQIAGNLLSNAAKYTRHDSHIWVDLREEDGHARLSVRDDGDGIEPGRLGELFQMYMQVGADAGRGLGIGLALVRSLVEMHGGRVEACSEGLHQGSEFIVWLPLLRRQA